MGKLSLILTTAIAAAFIANAAPAKRGNYVVTQPDGTTLTLHKLGDEYQHFTLTDDNMIVVEDSDGQYSYARIDDATGALISTKIKAYDSAVRPASHSNFVQSIDNIDLDALAEKVAASTSATGLRRTRAYNSLGKFTTNFPNQGEVRGLVILAAYSDKDFSNSLYTTSGGAQQYFTQLLNAKGFAKNNATGSAKDYFEDMSDGQFQPTFDVYGPVVLPRTHDYYGTNDAYGSDVSTAAEMIQDACQAADELINFSNYDYDGDGYVDNVFVFYAGTGEATSNSTTDIWPHSTNLKDAGLSPIVLDNVIVNKYACANEIVSGRPNGIGAFVHEFSHVMGLPDLYYTSSGTDHGGTPNRYSVLDQGMYNNNGCTPAAYGAYERNAMGWIDLDEFDGSDTYELENILDSNHAYVVGTSKEKEFYLFENRQQKGWDVGLPAHGMLIWHIDASSQKILDSNITNNTSSHQYVTIVKANNVFKYSEGGDGWPWPGSSEATAFSPTTTPAFKDWSGVASTVSLANIAENSGVISFDVTMPLFTPVPHADSELTKGDDYFYASWKASKGATDYKLWAYTAKHPTAADIATYSADMGSGSNFALPTGWTSGDVSSYTSSAHCGTAVPSAKLDKTGSYIATPVYDGGQISQISFWYKGINTNTDSYVDVQGLCNGVWTSLSKIKASSNVKGTATIADVPSGVTQVKLIYSRSTGAFAIDDVSVTVVPNTVYTLLSDFDGVLTGGNTSVRIDCVDGVSTYAFRVAATEDGKNFTDMSELRDVYLASNAVHGISADAADGLSVSVNNRTVTVLTDAARVEVYNIMGHHVSSVRVSDNQAVLDMPTAGMYVVRAGSAAAKVVVR
jgi:M6 family metalloprotease-like protein